MVIAEKTIILQTDDDLNRLLKKHNVSDVDTLADVLWWDSSTILVDDRKNAEYSQVNAQHSLEFFSEGLTEEEYNEQLNKKAIYGTC